MWDGITSSHDLDAAQLVQLTEACRAKDRLDKLDQLLRGDVEVWSRLVHSLRSEDYVLRIDAALAQANATANTMKQLLAAMRLPDGATGKRPQYRGPRGAQRPSVPTGVSAIRERLRSDDETPGCGGRARGYDLPRKTLDRPPSHAEDGAAGSPTLAGALSDTGVAPSCDESAVATRAGDTP